jgi:hypothetical protein
MYKRAQVEHAATMAVLRTFKLANAGRLVARAVQTVARPRLGGAAASEATRILPAVAKPRLGGAAAAAAARPAAGAIPTMPARAVRPITGPAIPSIGKGGLPPLPARPGAMPPRPVPAPARPGAMPPRPPPRPAAPPPRPTAPQRAWPPNTPSGPKPFFAQSPAPSGGTFSQVPGRTTGAFSQVPSRAAPNKNLSNFLNSGSGDISRMRASHGASRNLPSTMTPTNPAGAKAPSKWKAPLVAGLAGAGITAGALGLTGGND